MKILLPILFTGIISNIACAQTSPSKIINWHLLDFKKDGYHGISLKQAYELLKGRKSETVIVAVIDSGIDTLQDDLKENIWHNPGEIPANNIDDDKNGLIDDVTGWNFLGGANKENLGISVSEEYRLYHRYKNEFSDKKEKIIPAEKQFVFNEWKEAAKIITDNYNQAIAEIATTKSNVALLHTTNNKLVKYLGKPSFTRKELNFTTTEKDLSEAVNIWRNIFNDKDFTNVEYVNEFEKYLKKQEEAIIQKNNVPQNFRDNLLKDDGYDISKRFYGNNNLQTFSGYHGTSVSSIIGAVRNNNKGIDGIADNVKIMMIRAVLGAHEYDKDVAVAIRYAVDNGAKVINMSFGKPLSPDKKWVDDAIKYAEEKDVVLIHASGNDAENIDEEFSFPTSFYLNGIKMPHFINVGASGDYSNGALAAPFSNYGKKMVDIFAPGVDINCAIANNGTQQASGTSMASPVVAGIAALLRSYFPALTAPEVVDIIKQSGTSINENTILPGTENKKINFASLSQTGKIVNACQAVTVALEKYGTK